MMRSPHIFFLWMQYNKINIRYKLTDFYAFRNQKRFLNVVFLRVCIDNDVWKHMTKIIIHSQFSCMSGVYVMQRCLSYFCCAVISTPLNRYTTFCIKPYACILYINMQISEYRRINMFVYMIDLKRTLSSQQFLFS